MQVELNDAVREELLQLLETAIGDLSYEIADTDSPAYRRGLRLRRERLAAVRAQVGTSGASVSELRERNAHDPNPSVT